jgi:hypothetical protein
MSEAARTLMTRDEVIAELRVSERTFERKVLPNLTRVPIGSRVLFRWEEVDRWLRMQEVGPSNETHAPESTLSGFGTRADATTGPRAKQFAEKLKKRQLASLPKSRRGGARE